MAPGLGSAFPLEYGYGLLGDVDGKRVLDLGCGSGENSFLLSRRGAEVIGVDLSVSLIALAQRRLMLNGGTHGPVRFLCASAHHLPIPDSSIDVVFGMAELRYDGVNQTAAEPILVRRTRGRAIFHEPFAHF